MACLPAIRQALGEARWAKLAEQLAEHGAALEHALSGADQARAVEALVASLLEDSQVAELLLTSDPEHADQLLAAPGYRQHPWHKRGPEEARFKSCLSKLVELCQIQASDLAPDQPIGLGAATAPQPLNAHGSVATITDPCLEYQAFYLAEAAGDRQQQTEARRQAFTAELQRAADALSRWLELPPASVTLGPPKSADPRDVTFRYVSTPLERADGNAWARLVGYQVGDTYLLRCAVELPGSHTRPDVFADLQRKLAWQPDRDRPELLGAQLICYTSRYDGAPEELAGAVLGQDTPLHAALACGDLYAGESLQGPYLLVGTAESQEGHASDFFGQITPQLIWYTHRILSQKRQYYTHLAPRLTAIEEQIAACLDDLSAQTIPGKHPGAPPDRHGQLQLLAGLIQGAQQLIGTARSIQQAIDTSLTSYQHVIEWIERRRLFAGPERRELFVERQCDLKLYAENIAGDLQWRQAALDRAGAHPLLTALRSGGAHDHALAHKPLIVLEGSQTGDLSIGDVVGGDKVTMNIIYYNLIFTH